MSSRAPSKERRVTSKAAATVRNENVDDDLVRVEEVVDVSDKLGGTGLEHRRLIWIPAPALGLTEQTTEEFESTPAPHMM